MMTQRTLIQEPTSGEKIFTVSALLFFTGAFFRTFYGMFDPDAGASTGTLITNIIWSGIYVASFMLLRSRCNLSMDFLRRLWPLVLLLAIALFSTLWSDAPLITFLRFVAVLGSSLFGLYLATRYELEQQLVLLGWTFGLAAVFSVIFALAVPSYGIGAGDFEGLWLGIYQHKNILGINMVMGFMVFMVLSHCYSTYRWAFRMLAGLSLVILYFADSAASLVECMVILWTFLFLTTLYVQDRSRRTLRILVRAGVIPVVVLSILYYEQILTVLGRDIGLTGRTALWYVVGDYIMNRPYLGYGYFAFWRGVDGPLGDIWSTAAGGHNGFLDVWLDLGLLGLVAFLIGYLIFARRALSLFRSDRSPESVWPLLYVIWTFVANLTDSTFMRPNRSPWLTHVVVFAAVCMRSHSLRAPKGATVPSNSSEKGPLQLRSAPLYPY